MIWSASDLALLFAMGMTAALASLWLFGRIIPAIAEGDRYDDAATHVFTFANRELVDASESAQNALNVEDLDEDVFNQLIDRLSGTFPRLRDALEEAEYTREPFVLRDVFNTGPVSLGVDFKDDRTTLKVAGIPAPLSRKLIVDEDLAMSADAELRVLRDTVETSPIPTWREDALGNIDWINRAYLALLADTEEEETVNLWPPKRLFDGSSVVKIGDTSSPKRNSVTLSSGQTSWFDVYSFGSGEHSLHFAIQADPIVRAESSLKNFLHTLTQTFAYLPIGLAIFDRNRQLVLFNPSLMDLTSLEPEWLSSRPTLYDFLNRLREKRMLPEQKNFSDWRQKIADLEKMANNGTYCETWALPSSQTYRITGRPHPEGAIAFLFEDITAEISLTRKFRKELELSQSLFDSFTEAMAVFGADGVINMANDAYAKLWGVDPNEALSQISILDASRSWQKATRPNPLWGDVRDFIRLKGERSEWFGTATMTDGSQLSCRFTPLSGGATLVGFSRDAATRPTQPDKRQGAAAGPM